MIVGSHLLDSILCQLLLGLLSKHKIIPVEKMALYVGGCPDNHLDPRLCTADPTTLQ